MKVNQVFKKLGNDVAMVTVHETNPEDYTDFKKVDGKWVACGSTEEARTLFTEHCMGLTVKDVSERKSVDGKTAWVFITAYQRYF